MNREELENLVIFGPGGHNFDIREELTEIVSYSFLTSVQTLVFVFVYDQ